MEITSYHQGELNVQQEIGVLDAADKMSSMIKTTIMPAALEFISQQEILWIGIKDEANCHWTFPLFGSPGFLNPGTGEQIVIDLTKVNSLPEKWRRLLMRELSIGCLIIELSTRRRIRINGKIQDITHDTVTINVQQSFPNCPKYINRRTLSSTSELTKFILQNSGTNLNAILDSIISNSDTAFVTSSATNGIDTSHRGGKKGFIKTDSVKTVTIPDYTGNNMFCTLGNFKQNPVAGMMIIDFEQGYYLQLTGDIKLFLNQNKPKISSDTTDRYWCLTISEWYLYKLHGTVEWQCMD